jgi:hypothetical protein
MLDITEYQELLKAGFIYTICSVFIYTHAIQSLLSESRLNEVPRYPRLIEDSA